MKIEINIDNSNDAFKDISEFDRILSRIKGELLHYNAINSDAEYKLRDINGNTVGHVSFKQ